jgi:hypothetical protein
MKTATWMAAAALALAAPAAWAQSATTTATGVKQPDGATGGSAGSAAAGNTSASTVGVGATSEGASAIGVGGSAAAPDGRATTNSNISGNDKNAQVKAQAMDHGTFSKSHTHTKIKKGDVTSRTKAMAHVPGSKPVMSTSTTPASPTNP